MIQVRPKILLWDKRQWSRSKTKCFSLKEIKKALTSITQTNAKKTKQTNKQTIMSQNNRLLCPKVRFLELG